MTIRRYSLPSTLAALAVSTATALAQGAFPAPLPNQSSSTQSSASPFPPVNGTPSATIGAPPAAFPSAGAPPVAGGGAFGAPAAQDDGGECGRELTKLMDNAVKRRDAIEAAGKRKASPQEACKLFIEAERGLSRILRFSEAKGKQCAPPQLVQQVKAGHTNVVKLKQNICNMAQQQQQRGPAGPSLSDLLGSSTAIPEANTVKRSGGSTFDTLNGNVLTR